ncbi:MAG: nucleotidyltransferase family protein [Sphingomonas sp.]
MRVAILLAAGRSRRFVGANKLLARVGGAAIVTHAVRVARAAPVARVIVVTGHDHVRVARAVRGPRVRVVHARAHRAGVSASLRAGITALWPVERAIYVFLGDMPTVPPSLVRRQARALVPGVAAVRTRGRAGPGNPVLLRRPDADVVARLTGDRGFAPLIIGKIRWIDAGGGQPMDVDTRYDLSRLRRDAMG